MKRRGSIWAWVAAVLAVTESLAGQEMWTDPSVFHVNREPPHATLLPFADREGAMAGIPDDSPFHLSLNGGWRFSWAEMPAEAPPGFQQTDYEDGSWSTIQVLSLIHI